MAEWVADRHISKPTYLALRPEDVPPILDALKAADIGAANHLVGMSRLIRLADLYPEEAIEVDAETEALLALETEALANLGKWPMATADDIAAVIAGDWHPPMPTVLTRSDGMGLLYPGRVHSLAGEPGSGKTWIGLLAVAQVIEAGGIAVFIDYEDRLDTQIRRLVAMGVDPARLTPDHFRYLTPTFAVKGGGLPINVLEATAGAHVAIIDSMGEALAHNLANQNDDGEVAHWMATTARRLADGGAAVLILDHVTKDKEGRGRWAIGSQRKLAAIDGASFMVKVITAASKDREGKLIISVSKDRGGNFQHGTNAAEVLITPTDTGTDVVMTPPADTGDKFRPTTLMELVSRYLEDRFDPVNRETVKQSVKGNAAWKLNAINALINEGFVRDENHLLTIVTPFRQPVIDVTASPAIPSIPGHSGAIPAETGMDAESSKTREFGHSTFRRTMDGMGNGSRDEVGPFPDDDPDEHPVDNSDDDDDANPF